MSETRSATEKLLEIRNLSAGYGGMPVLRDATLEVRKGEIVALIGSNGAGKTTLLRALSRVIRCEGTVQFKGRDLVPMTSDQAFTMGLVQVPEGRQLFDRMSVEDNLLMGAYCRRDQAGIAADLKRVYDIFPRLAERHLQLAGLMSGGEQQMCAMARALMARPDLLMIDEMSLGLAPVVVGQLMEVLETICGEGVTVLLVEQDIHLALSGADFGYVMDNGAIVHSGKASALIDDPLVREAYLGVM
ncbi:MAG: ABC transporter ATP-binding protein [Alphaproteobacteria bacterium]|nr:ABC transporter ATP-binding protein [Alphaproteobacteria bacterium]